jgi:hypothetical protein
MLQTITKHLKRFKHAKRGLSNVIVVMLSLVILVVISANVILWSYQMNQLDWEKMQEDVNITNVERINRSSWFVAQSEYTVNDGSYVSGSYTDTQAVDSLYERFTEALATPIYYPNGYNVLYGTYLSGAVPGSVQTVDSDYFIVRSAGTATSTIAYNPSGYSLLGSTTHVSGTTGDLTSNNGVYMTFRSYASATSSQTLYTHRETATIGGLTYYLLKLGSADAAGTTLSADAGTTTGRKLMGKFVYQLTGVSSIPASTWTIYYRAYKGHSNVEAHGDVDILVRMSNGTIRSTLATNVANSGALTTSWSTLSGTYSWAAYTVIDQTDYLEIDYYIEVTQIKAGYLVYLRIDDNTLAITDQTRANNIYLPSAYTSEVELSGSSNIVSAWSQLVWTVDSAWTTGAVTVTLQLYNYTLGAYPTSGNGFISYTSSATANTDETKTQTITTNPIHFRDGLGNWKVKMKGVKTTTAQFDFKADWIEFKTTYYSEYTASTEFTFSNMKTKIPTQLNFTVVSEYNTANVSVTIQVWNYSSSAYVTSGEGYLAYTSSGSNETKLLSINTNPQFYTSNGNAKIKVTGVKLTTSQYLQKINQIKLYYKIENRLDINGGYVIDLSTYPLAYIQTVEIQLTYRASDSGEKWYLKAYNWTGTTYSDFGFNSTTGHTPTTGWDYYAVNLTTSWRSYVWDNGTIYVQFIDQGQDINSTTIDIDFLGVRVVIDGTRFTFKNDGALTSHLISLWVNNATNRQRYDISIFVNSGENATYIRADISLPTENFVVKVVTERGSIAVFARH